MPIGGKTGEEEDGWASDEDADPFATVYEESDESRAFDRIMNPVVKVRCPPDHMHAVHASAARHDEHTLMRHIVCSHTVGVSIE